MHSNFSTAIIFTVIIFFLACLFLFFFKSNLLLILFSLELLLLSNIFGFLLSALFIDDAVRELFGILLLVVAACETGILLSLLLAYYRSCGFISLQ